MARLKFDSGPGDEAMEADLKGWQRGRIRCDECLEKGGSRLLAEVKVEKLCRSAWVLDVGLEGMGENSAGKSWAAKRVGVCDGCGGWAQIPGGCVGLWFLHPAVLQPGNFL